MQIAEGLGASLSFFFSSKVLDRGFSFLLSVCSEMVSATEVLKDDC